MVFNIGSKANSFSATQFNDKVPPPRAYAQAGGSYLWCIHFDLDLIDLFTDQNDKSFVGQPTLPPSSSTQPKINK